MENIDYQIYLQQATDAIVKYSPRIILAILVIWLGMKAVKKLLTLTKHGMEKANLSPDLIPFLQGFLSIALKFVVIMIAATIMGIKMTSLVAILAAASFAVGFALQGSLANLASGLMILFFKPYTTGDWIQVEDNFGKVDEIKIFNTTMVTPGNKLLIVPNGKMTENVLTNFSRKGAIRQELTVYMGYGESFPKVKQVIEEALKPLPYIHHDFAPLVGIENFDTHFIQVSVKPFVDPDYYWEAWFGCNAAIKAAFSDAGIKMSYSEGIELGEIGA